MKKLCIAIIICFLFVSSFIYGYDTQKYENIAIGKAITAKSIFNNQFNETLAVDGDMSTVWGSSVSDNNQWIYIDLGKSTPIDGLGFKWFGNYYAKKYDLYISGDGVNWNHIVTITNGDKELYGSASVRYIGIYCTEKNDIAYGLAEFEVYVERPAPTPTATPTATVTPTVTPYYTNLQPFAARWMIDKNPETVIIDVREKNEFDTGHVEGSINMPWDSGYLQAHVSELQDVRTVVICTDGTRSVEASKFISVNGVSLVYNILGGIEDWRNIAMFQLVEVSSYHDCSCVAVNSIDGDMETEWISAKNNNDIEWVYIDMEKFYNIVQINVHWGAVYAEQFEIQLSNDGTTWTTQYTIDNSTGGTDTIDIPEGLDVRYLRVYCTKKSVPGDGYTIKEVELMLF